LHPRAILGIVACSPTEGAAMLTLTENAQTVIGGIIQNADAADTGGLRIAEEQGGPGLGVTVATAPEADDHVVEAAGVRVFLDPAAATALDDKVLDASASPDGRVDFAVGQQG
jgi:iron-sulfur cluster assembly protein